MIIEINEWDDPQRMDYQELATSVTGGIIRLQIGMEQDPAFHQHVAGFKKSGIPVAVSSVVTGRNAVAMAKEAEAFWYRGRECQPTFWWLEVLEETMPAMADGLAVYRFFLQALGAEGVGICTNKRLYEDLGINRRKFKGIWIKDRDADEMMVTKQSRRYDLYQGLLAVKCPGYDGWVNRIWLDQVNDFDHFFGKKNRIPENLQQWRWLTEPKSRKKGGR